MFQADPVGISLEHNTDEYDAVAETIVIALPKAKGPEDVQRGPLAHGQDVLTDCIMQASSQADALHP